MKRAFLMLALLLACCAGGVLYLPASAHAFDVFGNACSAGGTDSAVCQEKGNGKTNPLTGSDGLLIKIANIIALIAGTVAVFIIIIGGSRYITSGGDASKVESAKSTVASAAIGLGVIASADLIISFVLSKL